ncbi:MAG: hypothetical protein JRI23_21565 [Deltaproteobacteria bacterium]|jgi:hypothetical protein|nr:hypothetical protein [Deltaproteobacteria bacterium]MBW2534531.1 hypothetical protein [Deltaproteobacteria bacterium]
MVDEGSGRRAGDVGDEVSDEPEHGPEEPESAMAPTVPIPAQVEEPLDPPADVSTTAERAADDDPAADGALARPPKRKRRLRARFVIVGALLLGAAVYVLLNAQRWIHDKAIAEARRRGIELDLGSVDLDWDRVKLRHFRFSLVGVPGVKGSVELLQIDLDDLEPTRIGARGVRLEVEGSAAALAMAISEWTKNYPSMMMVPAKASAVDISWQPNPGDREWLLIEDAVIEPTANGGKLRAENVKVFDIEIGFGDATLRQGESGTSVSATRVTVAGVDLGTVGTTWGGDRSHIQLGFGEEDTAAAPVTIDVAYAEPEPTATITLRPTALERLAAPLGVPLPIEGVTASGTAKLVFAADPRRGPIRGSLQGTFEGYSPPVPEEVSSFVFGKTTHLRTEIRVSADRRQVELSKTHVQHGAFKLDGGGRLERYPTHGSIRIDLEGKLRCTDLADAAARAKVGGLAGGLLGSAARLAVQGSVSVKLGIEADTRNLSAAALDKTIGIGCGLKSWGELPIPQLPTELPIPQLPSFGSKKLDESR